MKRFMFVAACLLALCSYGQSKKFVFKLGEEYSPPRKGEDLSFFGSEKDGMVNLTLRKGELTILSFNPKTLGIAGEKTIEIPDATSNMGNEGVHILGNNYYWVHSDWNAREKRERLVYDKLDLRAGKFSKANVQILESDKISGTLAAVSGAALFPSVRTTGKYKFNYDAAQKNLMVSYRLLPAEKRDKLNYDKIGLFVYDSNMTKIWGNEFTMPYTEAVMDNVDYAVDGSGNAYILAKVYNSDARKEVDKTTGEPGYHFELLKYMKDASKPVIMPISLDNYFVRTTVLVENTQHEMIIASTYSKKAKGGAVDGVFLAAIDANGKMLPFKKGYYEFPEEELRKYESSKVKRKMDKADDVEVNNLVVRNVVVGEDGSVMVALEEYYIQVTYSSYGTGAGRMTSTTTYYYYNEILAMRIGSEGKVDWLRKIPKRQTGTSGVGTMSFKLVTDETGYYFLYLDNLNNLRLADSDVPKAHVDGYGGQVMVTKIDKDGSMKKEIVFDTREEEVMIFPSRFSRINGNQFIGRARLKKNIFQPLLITMK